MRKRKKKKLWNWEMKKKSKKKLSIFVSCAFSSSPFYIHLSFQIITLKQSHRTIPNCLAFFFCVICMYVFISFAVWFRRRFPTSFRFQFVKNFLFFHLFAFRIFLFKCALCMYAVYDLNERIIFLYFSCTCRFERNLRFCYSFCSFFVLINQPGKAKVRIKK